MRARPAALLLAFVGGMLLHVPSAAADTPVEADVMGHTTRDVGCSDGAIVCVDAMLSPYGTARYSFFLTSTEGRAQACGRYIGGAYTAIVTFSLPGGSVLTLDETGLVCGPGNSLIAPGGLVSYGNPVEGTGSWHVSGATGQFAGASGGGTDTFRSVGASFTASYTGILSS